MRLHSLLIGFVAFFAPGSSSFMQHLPPSPTHEIQFTGNSTASTRGGSTATFTRATASSAIQSGLVVNITSTNPAISQSPTTGLLLPSTTRDASGIHMGPATTNLTLRDQDLTNAVWTTPGGAPTLTTGQGDPAGGSSAVNVSDTSGAQDQFLRQTFVTAADTTTYTVDWWEVCGAAHTVQVVLTFGGGGNVATDSHSCSTGYQRRSLSVVNSNKVSLTLDLDPTNGVAATQGACTFWEVDLHNDGQPTLRDTLTVATAVTTNLETLTYSSVAQPDKASICAWVWPNTNFQGAFVGWTNGTVSLGFGLDSKTKLEFMIKGAGVADAATTEDGAGFTAWQQWHMVCVTYDQAGATTKMYMDGAERTYGTHDQAWTASLNYGTTLALGADENANLGTDFILLGDVLIADVRIWNNYVLPNGFITQLYATEYSTRQYNY